MKNNCLKKLPELLKKENIKLPSIKSCLKAIFYTVLTVMPFLLMDFFIRILARDVRYFQATMVLPNILFTVLWISLLSIIPRFFRGEIGRIIYAVFFLVFFSSFVANSIYYPYTDFFFGFNLLQSADEGSAYIGDVVKNTDTLTILKCLLVLVVGLVAIFKFPKSKSTKWKSMILFLAIFSVIYATVPGLLGQANKSLKWDTWRNPRNVYDSFSDQNKNMKICGLFEYTVRDFYITFLMEDSEQNPDEMELLENTYSEQTAHKKNKYTGFFKGKNVIFIQLEGMDSWLITPEDTPNLYGMLNNSLVFNNHYSYYTGGGSTFNSELAVSTGYITPISYTKNPYSFTGNTFLYSLPRQLKNAGYSANGFHMNTGEYYTRDINYKNWGYDNYYSLMDDGNYEDASYQLDRELILNEFFYEKIFRQKSPFMHYIITYTPHTPFSITSETAKLIMSELEGQEGEVPVAAEPQAEEPPQEGETATEGEEAEPQVSEEEVARLFASETDKMMGLLLQALKDNGLLRNTIIVAYADHYLYTLNDKTILDQYKTTENNLINETPFFIWSNGMRRRDFDKVNSQIDILPTVLNLLGIKYNDEWYIGRDIMDPDYQGYVFFSDRSWYDGVNYVENGVVTNNPAADQQYIMDTNTHMNNLIQKNDLTLKYDFFKKKRE